MDRVQDSFTLSKVPFEFFFNPAHRFPSGRGFDSITVSRESETDQRLYLVFRRIPTTLLKPNPYFSSK
jgi:hypothetical protein